MSRRKPKSMTIEQAESLRVRLTWLRPPALTLAQAALLREACTAKPRPVLAECHERQAPWPARRSCPSPTPR